MMEGRNKMKWIEEIKKYNPYNEQEGQDKEIILDCINRFQDILTRENRVAHITSSSFILNKAKDKALMIYHNIYDSWAWTGGHADGDEDLLAVAIKEAKEETGIKNIHPIINDIFSIDILPVFGHTKRGKYVSAHLHLNITYLLQGDDSDVLVIKEDENSGVKWISIDKINENCSEPEMMKVYSKLILKAEKLV